MLKIIALSLIIGIIAGCSKDISEHYQKAQQLIQEGQKDKALRYLKRVVQLDNSQPYKYPQARMQLVRLQLNTPAENESLIILLEEAATGDLSEAHEMLSDFYRDGKLTIKSPSKSFEWMQKAALVGHAEQWFKLGLYYFNGYGIDQNFLKARQYFSDAAQANHAEASSYLCEMLMHKKYAMLNTSKGMQYCNANGAENFSRAAHQLALHNMLKDKQAIQQLISNANAGWLPSSLYLLSESYRGRLTPYLDQILPLLDQALNLPNHDFHEELIEIKALYYRFWQKFPKKLNPQTALNALNQAMQAGVSSALSDWGVLNLDKSPSESIKALQLAAHESDPQALSMLGKLLSTGTHGLERDEKQALVHLESACKLSIAEACYNLAVLSSESLQIPRNLNNSVEYFLIAANAGHSIATTKLTELLLRNPELKTPAIHKRLTKINPQIISVTESATPYESSKWPWQVFLDKAEKTSDYEQKLSFLDFSRQSALKEYPAGFTRNYYLHLIEQAQFKADMIDDSFELKKNMQTCWDLLQIEQSTADLKQFFLQKDYKIDFPENLKRLERLSQTLDLHYALQAQQIYSESLNFWSIEFATLDAYFEALLTYRRAYEASPGIGFNELQSQLNLQRGELALRLAMINKEANKIEAALNWTQTAHKYKHPLAKCSEAHIRLAASREFRDDQKTWQLLIEALKEAPNLDRSEPPLQVGKAESFLLLSKMIESQRAPQNFSSTLHQYIFLRAASHFQSSYQEQLKQLAQKLDPRQILEAERQSRKWIQNAEGS